MTPHLFFSYFLYIHDIPSQFWYIDVTRMVLRALLGIMPILLVVPGLVWWERRLLGWMQQRQGPNRVGPFGLLQTIADGVKLLFKEDMNPVNVDKTLFVLAPIVFLIPSLVTSAVVPWAPSRTWGAAAPNVSIGILYILGWGSLGVYGIVLAGWSSNNKYSLLGGLRSSAQMISYELGMGLAVLSVVLMAGSTNMQDIVAKQDYFNIGLGKYGIALPEWNAFLFFPMGLIAASIYIVAMFAETNRAPFDLPEAETELVAGYHTEYTSMKFATFFLGEYANMIVVSAIAAALFFGGYQAPLPCLNAIPDMPQFHWQINAVNSLIPVFWYVAKIICGLYTFIWVRATLPRFRYDMLMRIGWQGVLPIALVNIMLIAVGLALGPLVAFVAWAVIAAIALVAFASTGRVKLFAKNTRRNTTIQLYSDSQPFRSTPGGSVSRKLQPAAVGEGAAEERETVGV